MVEGFDVGLEMSGNPAALREMIANMCHGAKIFAILGIPSEDGAIDWSQVVTKMLTAGASTAARCSRPGTKMAVMIEGGLGRLAGDHASFPRQRVRARLHGDWIRARRVR